MRTGALSCIAAMAAMHFVMAGPFAATTARAESMVVQERYKQRVLPPNPCRGVFCATRKVKTQPSALPPSPCKGTACTTR